ncbi:unnamed protein product [Peronospora belbahrii]|uniref:Uncharacterized protein n=1 Tax=Peronospora belbahrii TaxID=622444 RepID=A0ABN8DAC6_9STRA|nr:unnamed protein product [Peronospora belbahrii]
MELRVEELALLFLSAMVLALIILWVYRLVQYRKAVDRSQARWVAYEPSTVLTENEMGLDWPSLKPILLSPIPEERHESGRDSENDSIISTRRDSMCLSTLSVIAYGSFDHPVVKKTKV